MANTMFDPGREGFLAGEIDADTAVLKTCLVRSYTISAAHKFVSDLTGAGGVLVGTPVALGSKTITSGIFDAADSTLVAVTAGAACQQILIYQASAVSGGSDVAASAQRLICILDDYTNLPITPNGGDINIVWPSGTNRIFKL